MKQILIAILALSILNSCSKKEPVRGEIMLLKVYYSAQELKDWKASGLSEKAEVDKPAEGSKSDATEDKKDKPADESKSDTATGDKKDKPAEGSKSDTATEGKKAEGKSGTADSKKEDPKRILKETTEYYVNERGQNVPHGKRIRYFIDGQTQATGSFKDGGQEGDWYEYYNSGQKKILLQMNEGLVDGDFTKWYASGQINIKGSHIEGKQTGEWITYDTAGKEVKKENWDEGKKLN